MKKKMLIIDKPRTRSPLLTQFHDYLRRPNAPMDVAFDTRIDTPAEVIIKEIYPKGVVPDVIYIGFKPGSAIYRSSEFISKMNISIIMDMADPDFFDTTKSKRARATDNVEKSQVMAIVMRWPDGGKDYRASSMTYNICSKYNCFKNTIFIHAPWAISQERYPLVNYANKNIDVSFMARVTDSEFHKNRHTIMDVIKSMPSKIVTFTKNVYGDDYIGKLASTKILVVDGNRDVLTQKYPEGAVSGCLLVGNIPSIAKDIFVDGESFVETKEDYSDLAQKVSYYLKRPELLSLIAQTGRERD